MYCVPYLLFFFLPGNRHTHTHTYAHVHTHIPQIISMVTTGEGDDLGVEVVVKGVQKGNASIFF